MHDVTKKVTQSDLTFWELWIGLKTQRHISQIGGLIENNKICWALGNKKENENHNKVEASDLGKEWSYEQQHKSAPMSIINLHL